MMNDLQRPAQAGRFPQIFLLFKIHGFACQVHQFLQTHISWISIFQNIRHYARGQIAQIQIPSKSALIHSTCLFTFSGSFFHRLAYDFKMDFSLI